MPKSPIGWILTIAVPLLVVAAAVLLTSGSTTGSGSVKAEASAICANAQRAVERLPEKPTSIAEAMEMEHGILAILRREVSQLEAIAPRAGPPFRAALADERSLLAGLSSMIARPDFVQLSITLPDHPDLAPSWLKRWQAREQALAADAEAQLSKAGIPACERP